MQEALKIKNGSNTLRLLHFEVSVAICKDVVKALIVKLLRQVALQLFLSFNKKQEYRMLVLLSCVGSHMIV